MEDLSNDPQRWGGFASGAIELDSHWRGHDRVLGFSLQGVPEPDQPRFSATYLDDLRSRVSVSDIVGRRVKLKKLSLA